MSEVYKAEKVDSVIIAGDIFDSWNKVSIELLNVAIRFILHVKGKHPAEVYPHHTWKPRQHVWQL